MSHAHRPRRRSRAAARFLALPGMLWGAHEVVLGQTASFHRLGADVYPYGVSADGRVVVGALNQEALAFRWTAETGLIAIGPEIATAASADGSVVVGFNALGGHSRAFRWTQPTGAVFLGTLPGLEESDAYGVSGDGSIVVGSSSTFDGSTLTSRAYFWTATGGMVEIPSVSGFPDAWATAISRDGRVVIGDSFVGLSASGRAFRWTMAGGTENLGLLSQYTDYSEAYGLSSDGSVVVGRGYRTGLASQAFLWTPTTGISGLGFLRGGPMDSAAGGVSGDGSIIVGGPTASGTNGFIWTAAAGMRDIQDYLVGRGAVSAAAWTFLAPLDISSDGTTIIGQGMVCGNYAGWVARLGGPALPTDCTENPANCDCSTTPPVLNVGDFICFISRYAAGDPTANCDRSTTPPVLTANDFLCFISEFVSGCP